MTTIKLIVLGAMASIVAYGEASLVGHWKFDESSGTTAADSSSGLHAGTVNGPATFVGGGISGNAMQFPVSRTGYVRMGNILPMTSGSVTVSAWIKTTSTSYSIVAGKHDAGYFNGYFLGIGTGSGYGVANKAHFYHSNGAGQEPISTSNINTGQWVHLVGVNIPGVAARMYVNGNLEANRGTTAIGNNGRDFTVGGLYLFSGYSGYYDGLIDDVQVYDSALTNAQIAFLFNHPGWTVMCPTRYEVLVGTEFGGGLPALMSSDNVSLTAFDDDGTLETSILVESLAANTVATSFSVSVERSAGRPGLSEAIDVFNYVTDRFVNLSGGIAPTSDLTSTFQLQSGVSDYIAANRTVSLRVSWAPINDEDPSQDGWLNGIDAVSWEIF